MRATRRVTVRYDANEADSRRKAAALCGPRHKGRAPFTDAYVRHMSEEWNAANLDKHVLVSQQSCGKPRVLRARDLVARAALI